MLEFLPTTWKNTTQPFEGKINAIKLYKIESFPSLPTQPPVISHSLLVSAELSWKLMVHGHDVLPNCSFLFSKVPPTLSKATFRDLLTIVESSAVCPGNFDERFVELAQAQKGMFLTKSGEVRAYLETGISLPYNNNTISATVRTSSCQLITNSGRCSSCDEYRKQLRTAHSRLVKKKTGSPQKFTNDRFLNTPQRAKKMDTLRSRVSLAEKEVARLKAKIEKVTDINGVAVDEQLHKELSTIISDKSDSVEKEFPQGTFRRLFWDEQRKAAMVKDARQMRWHPLMIRWCLNLKLLSTAAYHSLRTSGFIKLPSERTLRDYTNYFKSKPGFQPEVDHILVDEASLHSSSKWNSYIVLLFDEMKVMESLVYDKHSAQVVGFTELGALNDQFEELERQDATPTIATHILCIMVRGIFSSLRFAYGHIPTCDMTGPQLHSIIWEAIERLERLGFRVVALTGDGATPNRKFFSMHSSSSKEICYKTLNPYTEEKRNIYFFSDVPHLMKTTRNCFSHSFSHNNTRKLWVSVKLSLAHVSFQIALTNIHLRLGK